MLELQPEDPLADGFDEDGDGGDDDQGAFKSGGEEGDALIAVKEVSGGRLEAEAEAETGEADGDDVDDRLCRVRKNGGGMGEEVGGGFAQQHEDAEEQGEAHGKVGVVDFALIPLGKTCFDSVIWLMQCGRPWMC